MWYLLCFGGGLVVGVAFLIWALVERSKRTDLELSLAKSRNAVVGLQEIRDELKMEIQRRIAATTAAEKQIKVLQEIVTHLREQLMTCRDPATVRRWLDDTLKKQI